jgi:hypothetical protein
MQTRMVSALDRLRSKHPGGVIVCVSHADPIKAAVAHALGVHERTVRRALRTPGGSTLERMIRLRIGHRAALGERANLARAVHRCPPPMEAYAG